MARPSITTVGTVSLPPATERTKAAASGSRQMLTCRTERRCHHRTKRNRLQNTQPGRQYRVILAAVPVSSLAGLTGLFNHW